MVIEIVTDVRIVVDRLLIILIIFALRRFPYTPGVNEIFRSLDLCIVLLVEAELSRARLSEEDEKVSRGKEDIFQVENIKYLIY